MAYVPWRGDVVWIDLEPQKGPEQAGHRPGVVLSRSDCKVRWGFSQERVELAEAGNTVYKRTENALVYKCKLNGVSIPSPIIRV